MSEFRYCVRRVHFAVSWDWRGDEVITSAYTYTASASPVIHVGAKVVLVDVAKDSYEMDYDKLEQAITERTKAIVPVDLGALSVITNASLRL